MIYCYTNWNAKSERICRAFAKGCGGKVVGPKLLDGDVFMYGKPSLIPLLRQAQDADRTWIYADNCYLGPREAHYRVTRNARQHDGSGSAGAERWERLGLTIKPWRKSGRHVLVCPQDALYDHCWGVDSRVWLKWVREEIKKVSDRPIYIRERSLAGSTEHPLVADLENCWALVTQDSNVAVDALLAGIPVFTTHPCAAHRMSTSLIGIENPYMPRNREQWAWNLAANQWTVEEMVSGECWRDLNDGRYEQSHAA